MCDMTVNDRGVVLAARKECWIGAEVNFKRDAPEPYPFNTGTIVDVIDTDDPMAHFKVAVPVDNSRGGTDTEYPIVPAKYLELR